MDRQTDGQTDGRTPADTNKGAVEVQAIRLRTNMVSTGRSVSTILLSIEKRIDLTRTTNQFCPFDYSLFILYSQLE